MEIIPIEKSHIESVAMIMSDNELWQRYGVTYDSAFKTVSNLFDAGGGGFFVAVEDGQVLGFILAQKKGAFNRSGYVQLIGVSPKAQGGGIGKALLTCAEDYVKGSSAHMVLLVSDFNTGAQRFYEREGYRYVGELPEYVKEGINEKIYIKRLGAQ